MRRDKSEMKLTDKINKIEGHTHDSFIKHLTTITYQNENLWEVQENFSLWERQIHDQT